MHEEIVLLVSDQGGAGRRDAGGPRVGLQLEAAQLATKWHEYEEHGIRLRARCPFMAICLFEGYRTECH